ncbi:hypothetical protein HDU83_002841, partial [Entophlyctis luteolus]
MAIDSTTVVEPLFTNSISVPMTPQGLCDWLRGTHTSSSTDSNMVSQEQVNAKYSVEFPLAGRDESLAHIASCFTRMHKYRTSKDRNKRPIPVCTGIPGLGKTRLMDECSSTVLDMTGISGERISVLISFGNDGNAYSWVDRQLGIECSFAWRVMHSVFKAQHKFVTWMRSKSPANRRDLSLELVMSTIDYHWKQKTTGNVLVFVGIDEYQKLSQDDLNLLLDLLCDSSGVSEDSRVTLFCMLAGTDLNMTRVARTSHPNFEMTPIRFLTHAESMKAIGPFISKHHSNFVVSEQFAQNVYYLGGVPRLLTKFSEKVVHMKLTELLDNQLKEARYAAIVSTLNPNLPVSNILQLLATSFSNTLITNPKQCPFSTSSEAAKDLSWSQMVSNGLCLIQDDGRVIVPFHLIVHVLEMEISEEGGLNEFELALLSSLGDFARNVEIPLHNVPAWLSWESFGAHFYCIRINSFLLLGKTEVRLSDILRGAR